MVELRKSVLLEILKKIEVIDKAKKNIKYKVGIVNMIRSHKERSRMQT